MMYIMIKNNKYLLSNNYLRPKTDKISKKKIYGFDIETYGKYNTFLMGSIVNKDLSEKYIFWDLKKMQNFILNNQKIRDSLLFATNLGFDFMGVFGNDFELMSRFDYIIRGSDIINVRFVNKIKKYRLSFLDTFSFFKTSVKNIGRIINLNKLKQPKFLGKKPVNEIQRRQLEVYNIRDSQVSCCFAEYLQNSFNLLGTNIKTTIASTALSLFQNKYLNYKIQQPTKEVLKEMYKSYYGARTEIFIRGKIKNLNYYDINSLYPYVMNKYVYPDISTIQYTLNTDIKLINDYEGFSLCYCELDKKLNILPLLPFRSDKLLFPAGKFYGWYNHNELRKAISLGYKIKPIKTYYFLNTINPFKNYVNDLYKLRRKYQKEKNKMQLPVKILMNSLYGKMAQKLYKTDLIFMNNKNNIDKINKMFNENKILAGKNKEQRYKIETPDDNITKVNGLLISNPRFFYVTDLDSADFPKFIIPIFASYVTSYARLELYKLFEMILNNNKKIYYSDTDSIITDFNFDTSKKLGKLKLEHKIKRGILIKPKMYYIKNDKNEEIYKLKGIPRIDNYDNLIKILDTKKCKYIKFSKFKESLRRKIKFNEIINIIKHFDFNDDKRNWGNNNFDYSKTEESTPVSIKQ